MPAAVSIQEAANSGVKKLDWAGGAALREVAARWDAIGAKAFAPDRRVRNARDAGVAFMVSVAIFMPPELMWRKTT